MCVSCLLPALVYVIQLDGICVWINDDYKALISHAETVNCRRTKQGHRGLSSKSDQQMLLQGCMNQWFIQQRWFYSTIWQCYVLFLFFCGEGGGGKKTNNLDKRISDCLLFSSFEPESRGSNAFSVFAVVLSFHYLRIFVYWRSKIFIGSWALWKW